MGTAVDNKTLTKRDASTRSRYQEALDLMSLPSSMLRLRCLLTSSLFVEGDRAGAV